MKRELIEAIKEDRLMDYISSNYHKFSKEELKILIVELAYHSDVRTNRATKREIIEELEDRLE